jgi:hypothetical protein
MVGQDININIALRMTFFDSTISKSQQLSSIRQYLFSLYLDHLVLVSYLPCILIRRANICCLQLEIEAGKGAPPRY